MRAPIPPHLINTYIFFACLPRTSSSLSRSLPFQGGGQEGDGVSHNPPPSHINPIPSLFLPLKGRRPSKRGRYRARSLQTFAAPPLQKNQNPEDVPASLSRGFPGGWPFRLPFSFSGRIPGPRLRASGQSRRTRRGAPAVGPLRLPRPSACRPPGAGPQKRRVRVMRWIRTPLYPKPRSVNCTFHV